MQKYRYPPCDLKTTKQVGRGGNGVVVFVPDSENPKLVVKAFSVDSRLSKEKRERRYKRFCREINVQRELGENVLGILPVCNACFPDELSDEKPAWFSMPQAEKFNVCENRETLNKLYIMLELAQIIQVLHKRKMAHRDIKPENLLFYENRIHLSDFGLVWISDDENLTQSSERLGPIKIMPPELDITAEIRDCDYRKSDVYLFAKVLWMYLKKDRFGFKGPYERGAVQIYLDPVEYRCKTFGPLHYLLEGATKDNWSDRLDIQGCIEYLKHQIMIFENRMSDEMEQEYIFNERLYYFDSNIRADKKVYDDGEKISIFFKEMIPTVIIEMKSETNYFTFEPRIYREYAPKLFSFTHVQPDGNVIRYVLHISKIEKTSHGIFLQTKRLEKTEIMIVNNQDVHLINEETVGEIKMKRVN